MKGENFRLAWQYLRRHRLQTTALVFAIALLVFLPLAAHLLVWHYDQLLSGRAEQTPLLIGAKGNRFDLTLKALYFRTDYEDEIRQADWQAVRKMKLGTSYPLHLWHGLTQRNITGRQLAPWPLVGTTSAYLDFRGLELRAGRRPEILGEILLGAAVARESGLGVGDMLVNQPRLNFDLSQGQQYELTISGVLAESGLHDDGAVFTDLKTTWILDGIGHGHADPTHSQPDEDVAHYQKITRDNLNDFHFHGADDTFPLTALIVDPAGEDEAERQKSRIRIAAHFNHTETRQALVPLDVVQELLDLVFAIQRLFNVNVMIIAAAVGGLFLLVVFLSLQLRRKEFETLFKIGIARKSMRQLVMAEYALIFGLALCLVLLMIGALLWCRPWLNQMLGV